MKEREELIRQLRLALHLAESPSEEAVEFDVADTTFCFEFEEEYEFE